MSERRDKYNRIVKRVSLTIFAATFVLQLCLAIWWTISCGFGTNGFYETDKYINLAQEGLGSDMFLYGYVSLIRFAMKLGAIFKCPYEGFIYFIQLAVTFISFAETIKNVSRSRTVKELPKVNVCLGACFIMTIPVIWHLQFRILPDAICLSLTVLIASKLYALFFNPGKFQWDVLYILAGGLILLGITDRHYFYAVILMTVFTCLLIFIRQIWKKLRCKQNAAIAGLTIVIILFSAFISDKTISISVKQTTQKEATYSLSRELLNRFVYPYLPDAYNSISEENKEFVTDPETGKNIISSKSMRFTYDYMNSKFIPKLEEYVGKEKSAEIYREMADVIFTGNTRTIVKKTLKELISYELMPFAMPRYIYDNADSFYGSELYDFWGENPVCGDIYMKSGMNGFLLAAAFLLVVTIGSVIVDKSRRLAIIRKALVVLSGLFVFNFTMCILSVQKFDYRIGAFSVCIWGLMFLFISECGKISVDKDSEKEAKNE